MRKRIPYLLALPVLLGLIGFMAGVIPLPLWEDRQEHTGAAGTNAPTKDDPWADKSVDGVLQLKWADLMPAQGNPDTLYDKVSRHGILSPENSDPLSKTVLAAAKAISARPQVVESLNGRRVRIAGLVVPLEADGERMREFLLVAYFGACIHVPPPPSNQIIHVHTGPAGVSVTDLFGSVWVTGRLSTEYIASEVGDAGYLIEAETVEPYE